MLKSIFFLLSFLLCLGALLFIPKTDKPVSFIRSMVICYMTELCLGALIAFPLSLLSISINLGSMGCVYLLLALCFLFYSFRKKQIQCYYFDIYDLITSLFLLCFILIVIWRVFSFQLDLTYYNSDPGVHFKNAMEIVRTGDLGRMYFAPLYNALFIELLEPFFSGIYAYKGFIIADSLSNYMAGMVFYTLISSFTNSSKIKKLSPIITILYFAGWPLYNYVLGGFVYWGIGVTLIAFGIYLLRLYQEYKNQRPYILMLLALTLYNIAMCYMLFIPYAAALFILTLIFLSWDKIKQINKKTLIGICAGVLLLCVGVFLFAFFNFFKGNLKNMLSALSTDGGIHLSFYRDFIFFLPLAAYACGKIKKEKTFRFNLFLLAAYLFMIGASLVLCFSGIMSSYYYYKLYYLLWLLFWLVTVDALSHILKESCSWFFGYLAMLAFMFVYTFTPVEDLVIKNGLMNYAYTEFPMYSAIGSYVKSPTETRYDNNFWNVIKTAVGDESCEPVPLTGAPVDYIYLYWYEAITGYKCNYVQTTEKFEEYFIDTRYSDTPAFAVMKECEYYEKYKKDLAAYPILFENDFAVIYSTQF